MSVLYCEQWRLRGCGACYGGGKNSSSAVGGTLPPPPVQVFLPQLGTHPTCSSSQPRSYDRSMLYVMLMSQRVAALSGQYGGIAHCIVREMRKKKKKFCRLPTLLIFIRGGKMFTVTPTWSAFSRYTAVPTSIWKRYGKHSSGAAVDLVRMWIRVAGVAIIILQKCCTYGYASVATSVAVRSLYCIVFCHSCLLLFFC